MAEENDLSENGEAKKLVVIDGEVIPTLDLDPYLDGRFLISVTVHYNN